MFNFAVQQNKLLTRPVPNHRTKVELPMNRATLVAQLDAGPTGD